MQKIIFIWLILLTFTFGEGFYFDDNETFNSKIYIETLGNPANPAVILVHGLGDEASTIWDETKNVLKNDYFVVVFDLPGFRNSELSSNVYSPENYAKLINTIAKRFVNKPFHLVGHSMGGAISLKYASMYKDTLASLVLIDAAGILHRATYGKFLAVNGIEHLFEADSLFGNLMQTPRINNFINNITNKLDNSRLFNADKVLSSPNLRKNVLNDNPMTIAALALVQTNFSNLLEDIDTNTLIIWGENDAIAPIQTGYVLNRLLQNSTMKIIADSAHVPMLSHKDIFYRHLKEHLANSAIYVKTKARVDTPAYNIKIANSKKEVITGHIKKAVIKNSNNILIKDAIIDDIEIINSNVEILNSTYSGEGKFSSLKSTLYIVASDLFNKIDADYSTLNIAGSSINTDFKHFIQTKSSSVVIYSLSRINNVSIHDKFTIMK
ncbi:MAG: alpha/beta hydrolase [Campylobacterota bacterium]